MKDDNKHRTIKGPAVQRECVVCRKYRKTEPGTKRKYTSWECKDCGIAICSPTIAIEGDHALA